MIVDSGGSLVQPPNPPNPEILRDVVQAKLFCDWLFSAQFSREVAEIYLDVRSGYQRENLHNALILLVPVERIELPTFGLQNRCSTAELNRPQTDQILSSVPEGKPPPVPPKKSPARATRAGPGDGGAWSDCPHYKAGSRLR